MKAPVIFTEPGTPELRSRVGSRLPGFYQRPIAERVAIVEHLADGTLLSPDSRGWLCRGGGLDLERADRMSENVVATVGLPMGLALNVRVNGADHLVPMAVEEPSVVAAASNAARLVRLGGGFHGDADPPVMTCQVQLDDVPDAANAPARIAAHAGAILAAGDAAIPRMVGRGGGCREVECNVLDAAAGVVVVLIHVDVGDAMGANLVDAVAEAAAPVVHDRLGGRIGLRILTNLSLRRRARAWCELPADVLGRRRPRRRHRAGEPLRRARSAARRDPQQGRDERDRRGRGGARSGLARDRGRRARLRRDRRRLPAARHLDPHRGGLRGAIELPMAVGIVGGGTRAPGARAALELVAVESARELAVVLAAVGLASNLAALRALAGEGIQKGHMKLHARRLDPLPLPLPLPLPEGGPR